ncbi:MAG: ABC transporter substrate-binding protein [Halobacteriales archaeon]|nr:ABC transporter substrate-binding protein [Halobacteriales archaeon]
MQDQRDQLEKTRRNYMRAIAASGLFGAAGLAGCSAGSGGESSGGSGGSGDSTATSGGSGYNDKQLVVLHGWTGGDGAKAIKAFTKAFNSKYGDMAKDIRAVGGEANKNLNTVVAKRLQNQNPPSSFANWPGKNLMKYEGVIANGEQSVWEAGGLKDAHVPEVKEACQHNGKWAAVPIGSHRMNDLFYNPSLLEEAGVDPSGIDSMDALMSAMDAVQENTDAAAWAHGMKGVWTVAQLFPWVLISQDGFNAYMNWIDGNGKKSQVRSALETIKTMQQNYVTSDASSIGFTEAGKKLLAGEAAFQHQGNWAAGLYAGEGAKYGEAWDNITFPGTEGMYGFHLDAFIYPNNNPTPKKTQDFLKFAGSETAHVKFNKFKGSIPTRPVPTDEFNDYLTATIEDFNNADKRPPTLEHGLAVSPEKKSAVEEALNQNMMGPYDVEAATQGLMDAV